MSAEKLLARVILRPDGKVHLAFQNGNAVQCVYANFQNLQELFSDPINFVTEKSGGYKSSYNHINRRHYPLPDVRGLTLASVYFDKRVVCNFPELFFHIFSFLQNGNLDEIQTHKPINMLDYQLNAILPDEKSFLLKCYLDITNSFNDKDKVNIANNINLDIEVQSEILRETLLMLYESILPEYVKPKEIREPRTLDELLTDVLNASEPTTLSKKEEIEYVTLTEYALINNVNPEAVATWRNSNRIKNQIQLPNGKWMYDKNEKPSEVTLKEGRKRKNPPKENGKYDKWKPDGSAKDVEEHIIEKDLFSKRVAPFIHTPEELKYYLDRSYHEVCLDGITALIIDVNPDFITSDGTSNRELMKSGKPPRVAGKDKEKYVYNLHHIGQTETSPLAIIPQYDHNSTNYSKIFHPTVPATDLHGKEFEIIKASFWRAYIEEYDKAGYNGIEYYNHRRKPKGK